METFPLNNLAEKFEVDRSVMVKAMRNVPPRSCPQGQPSDMEDRYGRKGARSAPPQGRQIGHC
jgi:hypothetical protein